MEEKNHRKIRKLVNTRLTNRNRNFLGKAFVLLTISAIVLAACKKNPVSPDNNTGDSGEKIYVDPSVEYQQIDGFGASDAWRCQFVGKNWPESKKNAIADLLFSQDLKSDGSPKGIGLSLWRFYLGAGSFEQGDASGISSDWRRAECFLNSDGTYNWNKEQGQQWFLQAAKDRGVKKFLAFTISPPVFYTKNGKAFAPSPADVHMNIQDGKMADYADYLVNVCDHFNQIGIPFSYLSPVNETQWDWTGNSQEGTPATNDEVAELVRDISGGLEQKGLDTKIVVSEAGSLEFLYGGNKLGRDHQIDAFFGKGSSSYIGDLSNVANIISGHGYWTTYPVQTLINVRQQLGAKLASTDNGPGFWQSEFSILENTDIGGGWNRDLTMNTALYVARVIHHDLTIANARSWQWWTALSQYDYKDGLIYLDNGNNGIRSGDDPAAETLKYDGNYRESKLLWALGNYSRFVRPGMVRVKAGFSLPKSEDFQAQNLMFSAFKDIQNNTLILVFVNYSSQDKKVTIGNLNSGLNLSDTTLETYVTSEADNLQKGSMDVNKMVIPARSVVTVKAGLVQ